MLDMIGGCVQGCDDQELVTNRKKKDSTLYRRGFVVGRCGHNSQILAG
jgi:hypothetical protein